MDLLADVLSVAKLSGTISANVDAGGPWGFGLDHVPFGSFHAVTRGTCWLRVPGQRPLQLVAGDVALLPLGTGHALASHPTRPVTPWDELVATMPVRTDPQPIIVPGDDPHDRIVCGRYAYDLKLAHPMIRSLPSVIHITAEQVRATPRLDDTLQLLAREVAEPSPGARTVVDHLVAVLFIQMLRAWAEAPETDAPWFRVLRDPDVAAALAAIHGRPSAAWTVGSLAGHVGVSRATLARRFTTLVGEPPLAYLTAWRMELAAQQLRTTDVPVGRIGATVGYTSESAFSRAFSRTTGTSPSRYRDDQRATAA
jgi:AraC-like DNA-binding protein